MKNATRYITQLMILAALIFAASASAQITSTNQVVLVWDPSPSTNITNYALYWGTASREYTNVVNTGTNLTATVGSLTRGVTYHFAATAKDGFGMESDFSDEATYTVPRLRPVPPQNLRLNNPNP